MIKGLIHAAFYENLRTPSAEGLPMPFTAQSWKTAPPDVEQVQNVHAHTFFPMVWRCGKGCGMSSVWLIWEPFCTTVWICLPRKVREQGRKWVDLQDSEAMPWPRPVDEVVEKSGETILMSSARNAYTVNRAKRMVKRSVWALQWSFAGRVLSCAYRVGIWPGR